MLQNLPANVIAAIPDDVLPRVKRAQYYIGTAAWRGLATATTQNAGQLAIGAQNRTASILLDGSGGFVGVRGVMLPATAADVFSATIPLLVQDLKLSTGESLLSQPTYAPMIFDNVVSASDLGEWPVGIWIPAKGQLDISLSNLDPAAAAVMIALLGWRIFY